MPILILIFVFLFGLIIGSFLNCLIWRLHKKEGLLNRSYCPKCKKQIAWYDNIPVLSFIMLKGKCRQCKKPISWQYPIVELTTGILFLIVFIANLKLTPFNEFPIIFNSKFLITILRDWFLVSVMTVIFIYDLRWYLILDIITLPACLIMLIFNLFLNFSLWNLLISGIIGGSFFLIQFVVSRGRWIGGGDIRLGLLMGLALGWPGVLAAVIIAYFIGSIVGVGLILAGKKRWGSEVPLGIFLSAGTIITLFWQTQIINWYFNVF
ncbi:prepilin peptidase [Candidatus Falkowbacteria bacterium]|nr:prepilin peptidase [Candidatus Falkowbacteria bacterium]